MAKFVRRCRDVAGSGKGLPLAATALATLWFAMPDSALADPDDCTIAGLIVTCQGNQMSGITSDPTFPAAGDFLDTATTLNVNNLTYNIAPAAGVVGINFAGVSTSGVNLDIDLGTRQIMIAGSSADGVAGLAMGASGDAVIDFTGDIYDAMIGINGYSANGNVEITSNGEIRNAGSGYKPGGFGINGYAPNGSVVIDHTGDITNAGDKGIVGVSDTSTVDITSVGNIDAKYENIKGIGYNGVTVDSTGNLMSRDGAGIYVYSANGPASAISVGDIQSQEQAIYVNGSGDVSATSTGNISSMVGDGIEVYGSGGTPGFASIVSTGDVRAANRGLAAFGQTGASITSTGDVTTFGGYAYPGCGGFCISGGNDAIFAQITGSDPTADILITSRGDVTSDLRGIVAIASSGREAKIDSQGDIYALQFGLLALSGNTGDAIIDQVGDITSVVDNGAQAISYGSGDARIDVTGDVHARLHGLNAIGYDTGNARVDFSGNLVSTEDRGIVASTNNGGNADIESEGSIQAYLNALAAIALGGGDASVMHTGDVTSNNDVGVRANADDGNASIEMHGDTTAYAAGLSAWADGTNATASVLNRGQVRSWSGRGITADATNTGGMATIDSEGDVFGYLEALQASAAGQVTIDSIGDLTSQTAAGIAGTSTGGAVSIMSEGDIQSFGAGISLYAPGGAGTDNEIVSTGDITSYGAEAITAFQSNSGTGSLNITSTGDLSGTKGISGYTSSGGDTTIRSTGEVFAQSNAIYAGTFSTSGNATVYQTGDVTSVSTQAIVAQSANGQAMIQSEGNVSAGTEALLANGGAGGATINHTGNVMTYGGGMSVIAQSSSGGTSSVTFVGDIDSYNGGIFAYAPGGSNGQANIDFTGNLIARNSDGLQTYVSGLSSTITSMGNIEARQSAIKALQNGGAGGITINSTGDLISHAENGIIGQASGGGAPTLITSTGMIDAWQWGIFGQADGTVDITQVGDVNTVIGAGLYGQSFSGNVNIDITGNINATGGDGPTDGIFAAAPNGSASVMVQAGSTITGGSLLTEDFAVQFGDGGTNLLTNYGWLNDANGGQAIGGGSGVETVDNYNRVTGSFFLDGGGGSETNTFNNFEGAWTDFGYFNSLGANNDFNNYGGVSPLGVGTVGTSTLVGDFLQMPTGLFIADVDFSDGSHDMLDVPDATGMVGAGGFVGAYITALGTTTGPYTNLTVIDNNAGAVVDNGITGLSQGPLQVTVVPIATTVNTVDINVGIDFTAGLSGAQGDFGGFLQNQFLTLVPGGLTPDQEDLFLALINSGAGYGDAIDATSPEYAAAAIEAAFQAAQGFGNNLFSCNVRDGDNRFLAQNTCAWGAAGGRFFDRSGGGSVDIEDRAATVAAGMQYTRDMWSFGFGAGYEHGWTDAGSADLDRDQFNAGVVVKRRMNALELAGAVVGGGGNVDSSRVALGFGTAEADHGFFYVGGIGRATYVHEMGNAYFKPILEGAATYVSSEGYTETGAGVANLVVDDSDELVGRGSAMLEVGTEFGASDGVLVRPFVGGGVSVLAGADTKITATMPGLSPDSFSVTSDNDSVYGDVKAGVQVLGGAGWTGRLQYDGHFSGNTQQHGGSAKLSIPF